jgi:hypothetical protein
MKAISSRISIKKQEVEKIMNIQKPITINQLTIKNRLVLPPMAVAKAGASDEASDKVIDYYSQRAKLGGIGLIITEHLYIHKQGKAHPGQMSIATDDTAGSFVRLTDAVHTKGVKIFAQLSHAGTAASKSITGAVLSRGILKLPPTVKKLQIIFSILLMIPIRVCCLPRHALFFFINQTGWIRVGCRGCAKRRAAIDSAQDWTDQAKVLSSESFLLCIQSHSCCVFPLTPFSLQSIFVC